MTRGSTQAQNHPRKGASIKVEPIRDLEAIARIKARLYQQSPRNYCLFTLGINTAYRAGELLSLNVGQVAHLRPGDLVDIKQSKTGKYRSATLNGAAFDALCFWLAFHPRRHEPGAPLFVSRYRRCRLGVASLSRLVKRWCAEAGLEGHYGSHSLRKTWGYHQRTRNGAPIPLLMLAYGHGCQSQTLNYLGIQDGEISHLYTSLEL